MSNSMIYLEDGSVVPVDKSELPVLLPEEIDLNAQGNPFGKSSNMKQQLKKVQEKKL